MKQRGVFLGICVLTSACIPSGSAPSDAGAGGKTPAFRPSMGIMSGPFFDTFDRTAPALDGGVDAAGKTDAGTADAAKAKGKPLDDVKKGATEAGVAKTDALDTPAITQPVSAKPTDLGPDWTSTAPLGVWRIEDGRLCGEHARNHGVWLNRVLPVNARIEFDAMSFSKDGDLKAEVWGDGRSSATAASYNNASSYLTIFGGWGNSLHVLARIDEHGKDRKEVKASPGGKGREQNVTANRTYKFKIERTDGQTVRWFVDGVEMHTFTDSEPLAGMGHDHFGFNDWEAKVCFDNVRVTPI